MDTITNPIIRVTQLTKAYPEFSLGPISFDLPSNSFMALLGPNGSGKTSIIKILARVRQRDSGGIAIFGKDYDLKHPQIKQEIGVFLDEHHFPDELMIHELRWILSGIYKNWQPDLFLSYMYKFVLPVYRKLNTFTPDMKLKLGLAVALSHQSRILLVDEPTDGYSPGIRDEIMTELQEFAQKEGNSVLFATHNPANLGKLTDRVAIINDGQFLITVETKQIQEDYVLVKFSPTLFDKLKPLMIGYAKTKHGFEGITQQPEEVKRIAASNTVVMTPATLSDLMRFFVKGVQ